jgi:hypothetical protein
MIRRIVLVILIFPMALWMLFDGIHVLVEGKYFGPPKPGPWSILFIKAGIDPFSLGPMFILFGVAWLVCLSAFLARQTWGRPAMLAMAVLSLWYLPFGTFSAVLCIALLLRR